MRTKKIEVVLVTLLAVFFLSSIALAVDCPIPDTGQIKCYNNGSEITCPNPEEPFYGQDAQYPCNPQSYTKLDVNSSDLPDEAIEWVMVRDNVTGLIWEVKNSEDDTPNYDNPHDADNTYTWYDGSSGTPGDGTDTLDCITALNNANFSGYSDWRLPTIKELSTIIDSSIAYPGPTINTDYFPNTQSYDYWSSTTHAVDPYNAWSVGFTDGYLNGGIKSFSRNVRAVRGGQCGSLDNFIDNDDGTVTDTDTGLMWQKDTAPGTYTWEQALSYSEDLPLANYHDWRLPNRNELQSLSDYSRINPATNFPNTVMSNYWSSTTYADNPYIAWVVYFGSGGINNGSKSGNYYVRAVRGGLTESSTTTTISGSTTTTIQGSTTTTTVQPCPTETLYGEHSEETELLRYFRDGVLSETSEGREWIRLYYQWSPEIVKTMEEDEEFKEQVKEMIDGVLELIGE